MFRKACLPDIRYKDTKRQLIAINQLSLFIPDMDKYCKKRIEPDFPFPAYRMSFQ